MPKKNIKNNKESGKVSIRVLKYFSIAILGVFAFTPLMIFAATTIGTSISTSGNVTVSTSNLSYTASNSPRKCGGTNYYKTGDIAMIWSINTGSGWSDTFFNDDGTTSAAINGLDQTIGNLNVFCVDVFNDNSTLATVVTNDTFANVKAHIDGTYPTNLQDDFEDLAAYSFNGVTNQYTWAGTFPGADNSGTTTWVDPPTLTGAASNAVQLTTAGDITASRNITADGNITMNGDTLQVTNGKLLFGTGAVPFISDYQIQAFKGISNPTGNVAGLLFGFQDSSNADVLGKQLWGINTGLSLYGDANFNYPVYSLQASSRLDTNNKTIGSLTGVSADLAITGGAHGGETRSNVSNYASFQMASSNDGGDTASHFSNMFGLLDAHNFNWAVDNWYGVYLQDHSAHAANSWGIYNLDRTYLSGNVGIGTSAPQSALDVGNGHYAQFENNTAGPPPAGDCDADTEIGRLSIDTADNRLYVCNGAARGWDYIDLTD